MTTAAGLTFCLQRSGTQESLMLDDRFSWKLCVSLIINRWRHIRV